jgi:hypothetical protein
MSEEKFDPKTMKTSDLIQRLAVVGISIGLRKMQGQTSPLDAAAKALADEIDRRVPIIP